MELSPFTVSECTDRHAMHMKHARGYSERARQFREDGDLRRSAWEQDTAKGQYRIAREYLECVFVLTNQPRTAA